MSSRSGKIKFPFNKKQNEQIALPRKQCPEVFVVRKTLTELAEEASLSADKRLMVDGMEVGVIYMRWVTNKFTMTIRHEAYPD